MEAEMGEMKKGCWGRERTLTVLLEGQLALLIVVLVLAATPILASLFFFTGTSAIIIFFASKGCDKGDGEAGVAEIAVMDTAAATPTATPTAPPAVSAWREERGSP